MTELLNVEFTDENGVPRRLTREELLIYINVVAGAGNETTTRLIGWAGKVLGRTPRPAARARRESGADPAGGRGACCASSRLHRTSRVTSPATWSSTARPCPQVA